MKVSVRVWVLLALSVGCGNAMALLTIEGTVVIEPAPATLLRGQTATITYTVTNIGDEAWDAAAVGVEYFESGPTSTVLPVPTAATPPCVSQFVDFPSPIPGAPTYVVNTNTLYPRPILPGESRQCVMDLVFGVRSFNAISGECVGLAFCSGSSRYAFQSKRGDWQKTRPDPSHASRSISSHRDKRDRRQRVRFQNLQSHQKKLQHRF